jgi:hypothetical protein
MEHHFTNITFLIVLRMQISNTYYYKQKMYIDFEILAGPQKISR